MSIISDDSADSKVNHFGKGKHIANTYAENSCACDKTIWICTKYVYQNKCDTSLNQHYLSFLKIVFGLVSYFSFVIQYMYSAIPLTAPLDL